jgi:hypothetical protein
VIFPPEPVSTGDNLGLRPPAASKPPEVQLKIIAERLLGLPRDK